MAEFIQEIKQRRILPAVGFYVGSCWVLIEILDRLVERYLMSPYITDIAFWGLYSLIPAVILMAWTHGKPGKDKSTIAEKVGVPINIIATLGLLISVFGGKDLGAAANLVILSNEEGVQESHYIPNESFRRRMAVFFFANESGDPELDWLQYGVTELLVQELSQNPFVLATSPWANFSNGFYMRMRQAGFEDGLGIPRSLMREIANDANRQYFIDGSVNRVAGEYQITARVWETQSLRQVAEFTASSWDLYSTIDALSLEIRDALEVPKTSGRLAEGLPLAETYGESVDAFQNFIAGLNARLFDNDFEASNAFFDTSVEADPGFVRAWFFKAINLVEAGDLPSSQVAIQKAQELDYRLPARDRVVLKALNYRLSGQNEKLIAFLRMQVRLRDDATSHTRLAIMLMVTGETEEAKRQFLAALNKDALNLVIYLQLSLLESATGNMEAAINYARKYQQEKPEDFEAHLVLGDLLRDNGDLDAADEHYLQASLLDQPVQPILRMADIAARKGNANAARQLLEQAEELAQTSPDKGLVRQSASYLERRLGRLHATIEQLHREGEYLKQSQPPFAVALATYMPMVRAYCWLGDLDSAQGALDIALGMVPPPMDQFLAFSEAMIMLAGGDIAGAESAIERGAAIIEQFKLEDLKFQIDLLEAYIKRVRGDHAGSAQAYRAALEKIEGSVLGGNDLKLFVPTLYAELAKSLVWSGALDAADEVLDKGFRLDPSEPMLWVSKAHFQFASGLEQLAQASVNYALAIWKDADPEYTEYIDAKELQAEIQKTL